MTHNAIISSLTVKNESVRAPGHDQVLSSIKLAADTGIFRKGLIVVADPDGNGIPCSDLSSVIGTGDGTAKAFSGVLSGKPLEPGSVAVTDGTEIFTDDGFGNLIGDAGGSGTVIYKTGAVSVTFNAAVANAADVTATAIGEIKGVLDRDVDTAVSADGVVIIHGTVKETMLCKGADSGTAAVSTDFELLNRRGIYPV